MRGRNTSIRYSPLNNSVCKLAPIALFAFRRPDHLRRTIEALKANSLASSSELYIFCDGARAEGDIEAVEAVRTFASGLDGFKSVETIYRSENMGLARSIISGVSEVLEKHGRIIVIEDDLVTSPHFLRYMNEALDLYAAEPRAASIHAYVYPVSKPLPETFFLRGSDCWGWATWARAWSYFNPDANDLIGQLVDGKLTKQFDMDGTYGFTAMLRDYAAGRNDSWAIRWHASAFVHNMLTLYPGRSLVENIGLDASGTNCEVSDRYGSSVENNDVQVSRISIVEDLAARQAFVEYFRQLYAPDNEAKSDPPLLQRRKTVWRKVSDWMIGRK
jgi:hypothetical protein